MEWKFIQMTNRETRGKIGSGGQTASNLFVFIHLKGISTNFKVHRKPAIFCSFAINWNVRVCYEIFTIMAVFIMRFVSPTAEQQQSTTMNDTKPLLILHYVHAAKSSSTSLLAIFGQRHFLVYDDDGDKSMKFK